MSASPAPAVAAADTADSLQDGAAWHLAFQIMDALIRAGLSRAEDWQTMYSDPVVAERIAALRDLQEAIVMLRLLDNRSESGRDTVWSLLEQTIAVAKDENTWYALRMLAYTSPYALRLITGTRLISLVEEVFCIGRRRRHRLRTTATHPQSPHCPALPYTHVLCRLSLQFVHATL